MKFLFNLFDSIVDPTSGFAATGWFVLFSISAYEAGSWVHDAQTGPFHFKVVAYAFFAAVVASGLAVVFYAGRVERENQELRRSVRNLEDAITHMNDAK